MKNATLAQIGAPPGIALASLALRRGLVTAREVRRALSEQALENGSGRPSRELGLILLTQGSLTEETLQTLLADARLSGTLEGPEDAGPSPLEKWGRRIGRYVLIQELGRGTAAVTYEAQDTVLERRVALKVFNRQRAAESRQDEERFVREARLAAAVPPHPHLVPIFDAGCEGGERYIAMDLVRGRTFESWRRMGGPVWKSVAILRDIARAIHHAHEHGIVHRDLKPANILIDSAGEPHITDFGLAKNLQGKDAALTSLDSVVGTPCYMSPEQAQGAKDIDRRSDVYALGVMLYEILTGELPFRGRTAVETMLKAIHEPLRPPSAVVRAGEAVRVDRRIERICLRALSRKPADRQATARELAEELEGWLTGEARPSRTRLRILLGALAAAVLLAAGAQAIRWRSSTPAVPGDTHVKRSSAINGR